MNSKESAKQIGPSKTSLRSRLHGAIYCPDSFVLMLRYCANLKAIRYESTSLNRIVANKSYHVIVAYEYQVLLLTGDYSYGLFVYCFDERQRIKHNLDPRAIMPFSSRDSTASYGPGSYPTAWLL